MFDNFNIDKFKSIKPPADNSSTTMNEIKKLVNTRMDISKVKKYDNIEKTFKDIAVKNNITNYDESLVKNLIKKSAPIIMQLKNYYHIMVSIQPTELFRLLPYLANL